MWRKLNRMWVTMSTSGCKADRQWVLCELMLEDRESSGDWQFHLCPKLFSSEHLLFAPLQAETQLCSSVCGQPSKSITLAHFHLTKLRTREKPLGAQPTRPISWCWVPAQLDSRGGSIVPHDFSPRFPEQSDRNDPKPSDNRTLVQHRLISSAQNWSEQQFDLYC